MATRRAAISEAIQNDVASRDLGSMPAATGGAGSAAGRAGGGRAKKAKKMVRVWMDEDDFARLQQIGEARGTNASALIRLGVKQVLKESAAT